MVVNLERRWATIAHYVMGDIHGEADRFHAMLEKIHFSEEDTLILLGDVIDRGPDGIKILSDMMKRKNVVMFMGNHELMMLDALKNLQEIQQRISVGLNKLEELL